MQKLIIRKAGTCLARINRFIFIRTLVLGSSVFPLLPSCFPYSNHPRLSYRSVAKKSHLVSTLSCQKLFCLSFASLLLCVRSLFVFIRAHPWRRKSILLQVDVHADGEGVTFVVFLVVKEGVGVGAFGIEPCVLPNSNGTAEAELGEGGIVLRGDLDAGDPHLSILRDIGQDIAHEIEVARVAPGGVLDLVVISQAESSNDAVVDTGFDVVAKAVSKLVAFDPAPTELRLRDDGILFVEGDPAADFETEGLRGGIMPVDEGSVCGCSDITFDPVELTLQVKVSTALAIPGSSETRAVDVYNIVLPAA